MQNRPNQPRARVSNEAPRPNSLGLHQRELADLLDQFDGFEAPPKNIKRDFVRWPFRRSAVPVKITHPNGISAEISVACRNISRGGMAFLHRGYLHTGTRCTVRLPHPEAGELVVDGWVARCLHRSGLIHEIGVAFSEEIDVRDLLRPDPLSDCFTLEKVDVENLEGSLLYVDPSEADQKIVRHFLRSTRVRVATAFTPTDAMPHLAQSWDVIIVDSNLPEGGGAKFVHSLRERGHSGAVIVTTSDTSATGRRTIEAIEADAFLGKPLGQSVLIRAVAEFILGGRDAFRPSVGTLGPDHPDYQSAVGFALTLRHAAKKLEDTVRREDAATCKTLCQQLAGSAPPLGFAALGKLAADASATLTRTMSISASIKQVRALIAACERARARKAA